MRFRLIGQVAGFALIVSLVAGLALGFTPVLFSPKTDFNLSLKDGARNSSGPSGGAGARNLLVIFEFAVALMVVICAGLAVRSLINLRRTDPGLNPEHLLLMNLDVMPDKYPNEDRIMAFYRRLSERLQSMPGVESTALNSTMPFARVWGNTPVQAEDSPPVTAGDRLDARFSYVTHDYFVTSETRLVAGRFFSPQDTYENRKVVVINREMADRFWPGQNAIGKRIRTGIGADAKLDEVVGVAGDVRYAGLDLPAGMEVYYPYCRQQWETRMLLVRTSVDPMSLAPAIQREIRSIDPDQPLTGLRTGESLLSDSLSSQRFLEVLLAMFAVLALVLGAIGIFGVMSYSVTQRKQEMGIRMAIGAKRFDIIGLVVGQGMRLTLFGVALGLILAGMLAKLMSGLLYGVSTRDPITFLSGAAIIGLAALISSYIPAYRATRVDPVAALRSE